MTIKLKAKEIGINKLIEVKPTISVVDMADEMMIKLLQMDEDDAREEVEEAKKEKDKKELTPEEQKSLDKKDRLNMVKSIQKERDFTKESFDFLQTTLKLTDKQVDHAKESIEFDGLGEYLMYVIGRIKGRSDADFELDKKVEAEKAKSEDPKKG
ncbi:phage tail tube assembly chaperone [Furfurilactobacillus entadae]|uniref:phage tail tube assembly chaperone n=1 Tax=Furfurilactobacillus entadae TaxID=2922307 RepID=UPI0035E86C58